jgi:hypothetical protein
LLNPGLPGGLLVSSCFEHFRDATKLCHHVPVLQVCHGIGVQGS